MNNTKPSFNFSLSLSENFHSIHDFCDMGPFHFFILYIHLEKFDLFKKTFLPFLYLTFWTDEVLF